MSFRSFWIALVAATGLLQAGAGWAQSNNSYPNRSVKIILPYAAGAATDLAARVIADELRNQLKQPFVVENRNSVSGILGSQVASQSPPDGYTLLFAVGDTLSIARYAMANVDFILDRDLTPIIKVATNSQIMVVNPKVAPVNDPRELVEFIKKTPNFNWGTGGVGTPGDIATTRFFKLAGVNPLRVPYPGTLPGMTAMVGGEIAAQLMDVATPRTLIEAGTLRALGVAALEEDPRVPGMRTIASYGFPGFESASWYAIWGPKGMDPALADQLNGHIARALTPEVRDTLLKRGVNIDKKLMSTKEFSAYIKSVDESNAATVKEINLKPQ